jgi:amino acid transporter
MMHAALITLFTPFNYLSDMTSISSLFSFFLVALALLWRRYYCLGGREAGSSPWPPALHLLWLLGSGIGASILPLACSAMSPWQAYFPHLFCEATGPLWMLRALP